MLTKPIMIRLLTENLTPPIQKQDFLTTFQAEIKFHREQASSKDKTFAYQKRVSFQTTTLTNPLCIVKTLTESAVASK